ncbi:STAS/SEC14 domain-containing protein [Cognatishimia sp. MH4019]|uniref:STAS/SEC14 domain-containing protein n=1 Tax=Cognatishimia sp. MH4019 TaxID=2854030 RepID=UPI001CD1E2A6|nr:STAS/SEC14 domain-containing protein [Cognatishimia sp. MH4019]
MLTFDRISADLLEITARGTITEDEVRRFYAELWPAIADAKKIGLIIDLSGFGDMTGRAIIEDLTHEAGALPQLKRFPRIAILTDKQWIRTAERFMDPILPMTKMECFDPADRDAARAFAQDLTEHPKPKGKGLRLIDSEIEGVLAFELDGYMSDAQADAVAAAFRAKIETSTPFDAFARIKRFGGFDPQALVQKDFIQMKMGAAKQMRRYAIVTDERWIKPMVGIARAVTGIEIEVFAEANEPAAWDWLRGISEA